MLPKRVTFCLVITVAMMLAGCSNYTDITSMPVDTLDASENEPLGGHCEDIMAQVANIQSKTSGLGDGTASSNDVDLAFNAWSAMNDLLNGYDRSDFTSAEDFEVIKSSAAAFKQLITEGNKAAITLETYDKMNESIANLGEACSVVGNIRSFVTFSGKGTSNSKALTLQGDYQVDWKAEGDCFLTARFMQKDEDYGETLFEVENAGTGQTFVYGLSFNEYYVSVRSYGSPDCAWNALFNPK